MSGKKDRIIKEVRTALDGLFLNPGHGHWNEAGWTKEVRIALCKAGEKCGAHVRAARNAGNQGEWLYDVACLKYGGNGNNFLEEREVLLVAQVTWGNREAIPKSFVKLPVARAAAVRVMVHNCTDPKLTDVFTNVRSV